MPRWSTCRKSAKNQTDAAIGRLKTIDDLFAEGFRAVFLGVGAGAPVFMNIPGENLSGIYSANEYLTRSNLMKAYRFPEYDTPIAKGRNVAVIGGGNVAMDSVRTALRLGADNAIIIYRRTKNEMPARAEEVHHAEEEGVKFQFLTNPIEYIGDEKGWVRQMVCQRMELGEPDDSGRRRPVVIKGSEFTIDVDTVVVPSGRWPIRDPHDNPRPSIRTAGATSRQRTRPARRPARESGRVATS